MFGNWAKFLYKAHGKVSEGEKLVLSPDFKVFLGQGKPSNTVMAALLDILSPLMQLWKSKNS